MSNFNDRTPPPRISGWVGLARVFWFFIGPMTLGILSYAILTAGNGWVTWLDFAFFIVATIMIVARRYELKSGMGKDGFGEPATEADFPKYAVWAISASFAVWGVANIVGNHLLG
jgi:hypothetical protein